MVGVLMHGNGVASGTGLLGRMYVYLERLQTYTDRQNHKIWVYFTSCVTLAEM